jgi:hypothetical protein
MVKAHRGAHHGARYKQNQRQAGVKQGIAYLLHLHSLIFQGDWGHGAVQYRKLGEDTLMTTRNLPSALQLPAAEAVEQAMEVSTSSWRQIAIQATSIWLVSRVMLALLTYFAALFQANLTSKNPVLTPDLLLGRWFQWDATNYLYIAHFGYNESVLLAFFPLYPLLVHLLTFLIGGPGHELLAGVIISNLGTLAAFIGLGYLVAHEGGDSRTISHTLLVLVAYPFAFFLAAPYTEGLFLAFAVWALVSARRGAWYLAACCTFLGALCRSTAVILVLPLIYEFGRQHGWWQQVIKGIRQRHWGMLRRLPRAWSWRQALMVLAIFAAVPVGFGIFALVCAETFGDPLLFIKVQSHWGRIQLPIWTALWRGFLWQGAILFLHKGIWSYENARNLVDLAPVVIFSILTVCSLRRMPMSFILYMFGLLYITIAVPVTIGQSTVEFDSAGRFFLLAVPIFMVLGRWSARFAWVEMLLVGGGFLLQAVFASYFLAGGWLI